MINSNNRAYVKSDECKSQYAEATVFINSVTDLSVTKTSKCNKFEVNKIITYIINVKNNGPSKASGVVLNDVLPHQLSLIVYFYHKVTLLLKKDV